MSQVHGIELSEDGKPAYLRLGFLRLLYRLYGTISTEPTLQASLQRLHSETFRHQVSHFQQCFWKFDRAAGHVARCRNAMDGAMGRYSEKIKRFLAGEIEHPDPSSDPDDLEMRELNMELPVFLDAMLFYLRIQADSYAKLTPYLYERVAPRGPISTRSFRDQAKWFTKAENLDFHPEYSSLLKTSCAWFDRLAGREPKGLRDVVIHHSGMLSIGWSKPPDALVEPNTALYGSSGIVETDVFGALREITAGWYAFLDAAWRLFVALLTEAGLLLPRSVNESEEKTRYADSSEIRGLWVYPTFKGGG